MDFFMMGMMNREDLYAIVWCWWWRCSNLPTPMIWFRWWGWDKLPPSKYGLVQGGLVGANPKSLWQLHIPTFYKYLLFLLRFHLYFDSCCLATCSSVHLSQRRWRRRLRMMTKTTMMTEMAKERRERSEMFPASSSSGCFRPPAQTWLLRSPDHQCVEIVKDG